MPTIEIEESDHLNHSAAFALAARGWAENVSNGVGPREATLHWSHKTLAARINGAVVGVLVWDKLEANREAWIVLGYVDPEFRGRGVYTKLYRHLLDIAKREKLRCVSGGVSITNHAMRAVAERQGRIAVALTYSEEILP